MAWTITTSVYLDENRKMRRANAATQGRAELVFMWLLRLARRRGFGTMIPAGFSDHADIADHRRMAVDLVVEALSACATEKILKLHDDGGIEILPDADWVQPMTPAERKAAQRARTNDLSREVTEVTSGHVVSRDVQDSHAESRESRSGSGPILSLPEKDSAAVAAGAHGMGDEQPQAHAQSRPGQVALLPAPKPRIAQKGDRQPLPFQPVDLFRVLGEASRGRFTTDGTPLDKGQSIAVVKTIRSMEAKGYTLADARLAGEFIASWTMEVQFSVGWVMKRDGLFDTIGKARGWDERGRPALGKKTGPAGSQPRVEYEDVDDWRTRVGGGSGGGN